MKKAERIILVGAQWGDEGKGRITDLLAEQADVVVRFSGGPNAGHTVIVGDKEYNLHLIPSGILYPSKDNVVGNGVVLHPPSFLKEMEELKADGISLDRLFISANAHVILPTHMLLDRLQEEARGGAQIGTTRKGIGPAYSDKIARRGVRLADMMDETMFRLALERNLATTNLMLEGMYGHAPVSVEEILEEYLPLAERLRPHVVDTTLLLDKALKADKSLLFEGAQGTLLDIDHGSYPFVTSSNPTSGGVCTGTGVGPTLITEVVGIAKAYLTRVGAGPFPSELDNEIGVALQTKGGEIGVTTGRIRRCGWLDIPLLRHAIRVNGLTQIVLTKLDVLSGFDTIRLCTHYKLGDTVVQDIPYGAQWEQLEPVYEECSGWNEDLSDIRDWDQLPLNARRYVERIEELCERKISIVSIGPKRSQDIRRFGSFLA